MPVEPSAEKELIAATVFMREGKADVAGCPCGSDALEAFVATYNLNLTPSQLKATQPENE